MGKCSSLSPISRLGATQLREFRELRAAWPPLALGPGSHLPRAWALFGRWRTHTHCSVFLSRSRLGTLCRLATTCPGPGTCACARRAARFSATLAKLSLVCFRLSPSRKGQKSSVSQVRLSAALAVWCPPLAHPHFVSHL